MNAPQISIDLLAASWEAAKAEERAATERRRAIEKDLIAILPSKDEGTVSAKTADGARIAVTFKQTRKVDATALVAGWNGLSQAAQSCFKWRPEIDLSGMRAAQQAAPEAYAEATRFFTTTPATPSVSVERQ